VENVEESVARLIDEKAKHSVEFLVWIGYILFKRLIPDLKQVLVSEDYERLPQCLFYPLIEFEATQAELDLMDQLNAKYSALMRDIFSVMVPGKKL
jgi:hypothetical protein